MLDIADAGGEFGDELADGEGIGFCADGAFEGLLELGRGDHLHGLGDLADVSHRLAPLHDCTSFGHWIQFCRPGAED